ncbi:glycosyltransferase family 2 protein [Psychromarinibacter sp. C21-152]|uniref:Glycosyltransferase family 2 protein n=1 Tax=Psychromarinibacter sediminicola TaxID=3033385 RepID=A0AAE3NT25_9RHOB|nr:glycosyltransferase family 2 protein [Psychromarinibacter sediminicola]MDF0601557.1 glycosyltransferase family 2 protein [Psychromarinibacter sediminicola]
MRISVVTAVFNRRGTIGQTIDSVKAQTYRDREHIIQDGGSTDGTADVVAERNAPGLVWLSEPDGGIYDAINRGIQRASGDVIGLMHSDDFFAHNEVLDHVAEAFAEPDVDGVYGDLDYVSAAEPSRIIRRWRSGPYDPTRLTKGWMPPHPTLYLKREVFETYGLYDTSYRIAADYDAMLRYLAKGEIKLAYIPEVIVKMRVGGESNRSIPKILRKSREDLRALRSNGVGGIGTLALKNFSKVKQFF